jgi:aminotransferase
MRDDATAKRRTAATARPSRADGRMRIVVPLQGVVQGRGGLVLGSLIPCALFYFLQLYIKRNRPPAQPGPPAAAASPVHRSTSRGLLAPRPALSARAAAVRVGDDDSLYYAGIRRCARDLYHPASNPAGIVNLGLAENHVIELPALFFFREQAPNLPALSVHAVLGMKNSLTMPVQLSLDLVGRWMEEHAGAAMLEGITGTEEERDLTVRGLATYQPYDGILALKMVSRWNPSFWVRAHVPPLKESSTFYRF